MSDERLVGPYQPKRMMIEDTSAPAYHEYWSTACYHNYHSDCRFRCKICEQPCRCECHARQAAELAAALNSQLVIHE